MNDLVIKPEYGKRNVAFRTTIPRKPGTKPARLGERTQSDLIDLAIIGLSAKDKSILKLFEGTLPSLDDLKAAQLANKPK